MSSGFITVWLKELKDAFRDRRSVMAAMSYALFGPMLVALSFFVMINEVTSESDVEIQITGAEHAPALVDFLETKGIQHNEDKSDTQLRIPEDYSEKLSQGESVPVIVRADYSERSGSSQRNRLESALREYNSVIASHRLMMRGISPEVMHGISIDKQDTATQESRAALMLGTVMIFVLMAVFFSGMNVAIDTSAGERERNSLEFVLAQPVSVHQLISAKAAAATVFATLGGALSLILIPIAFMFVPLERLGVDFSLTLYDQVVLLLVLIPLALFASFLQLFVSFRAKNFKEAQTYISLVMMAPMIVVFVLEFSRFEYPALQYLPVTAQHQVVLSAVGSEQLNYMAALTGSAVTLLACALVGLLVTRMLRSEKVVFGL